jgi:hypothetical protein
MLSTAALLAALPALVAAQAPTFIPPQLPCNPKGKFGIAGNLLDVSHKWVSLAAYLSHDPNHFSLTDPVISLPFGSRPP